ncbi:hypothetical protein LP420_10525 [Massilia sp. B-10]|nr:hypothetical protein LP420_10525 [Massilia sp. B-10]
MEAALPGRGEPKDTNKLVGVDALAADHVLAVITNGLDDQLPLRHLLEKLLVSDILDVAINDVELIFLEVGTGAAFSSCPKRAFRESDASDTANTSARRRNACRRTTSSERTAVAGFFALNHIRNFLLTLSFALFDPEKHPDHF